MLQCALAGSTSPRAAWQAGPQWELKGRPAECRLLCGERNQQRAALRKTWACVVGSESTGTVLPYHHVHCLGESHILASYLLAGISEWPAHVSVAWHGGSGTKPGEVCEEKRKEG